MSKYSDYKKLCKITPPLLLAISPFALADNAPLQIYAEEFFAASWAPGNQIKAEFEQANPQCQVVYTEFDSSSNMLNRIRLEGKKSKADLVIGLDNFQLATVEDSPLFAPNQIDLDQLALPLQWTSHKFLPYNFAPFAFIYDKDKLKNPPTSLKELVERQELKILYPDPRTSVMGRGLVIWLNQVYGQDKVNQAWQTLSKHTLTIGKGWSASYGAFLKGEGDLVLSQATSPLYHQLKENKSQYVATDFSEGAIFQVQTAVKLASSQHSCAEPFLQFLLKPEVQKLISESSVTLPVIKQKVGSAYDQLKDDVMKQKNLANQKITHQQLKDWILNWQKNVM